MWVSRWANSKSQSTTEETRNFRTWRWRGTRGRKRGTLLDRQRLKTGDANHGNARRWALMRWAVAMRAMCARDCGRSDLYRACLPSSLTCGWHWSIILWLETELPEQCCPECSYFCIWCTNITIPYAATGRMAGPCPTLVSSAYGLVSHSQTAVSLFHR